MSLDLNKSFLFLKNNNIPAVPVERKPTEGQNPEVQFGELLTRQREVTGTGSNLGAGNPEFQAVIASFDAAPVNRPEHRGDGIHGKELYLLG